MRQLGPKDSNVTNEIRVGCCLFRKWQFQRIYHGTLNRPNFLTNLCDWWSPIPPSTRSGHNFILAKWHSGNITDTAVELPLNKGSHGMAQSSSHNNKLWCLAKAINVHPFHRANRLNERINMAAVFCTKVRGNSRGTDYFELSRSNVANTGTKPANTIEDMEAMKGAETSRITSALLWGSSMCLPSSLSYGCH